MASHGSLIGNDGFWNALSREKYARYLEAYLIPDLSASPGAGHILCELYVVVIGVLFRRGDVSVDGMSEIRAMVD